MVQDPSGEAVPNTPQHNYQTRDVSDDEIQEPEQMLPYETAPLLNTPSYPYSTSLSPNPQHGQFQRTVHADHSVVSFIDQEDESAFEPIGPERRSRFSWLPVLLLPGRFAVGVLSFLAGTGLSKKAGFARSTTLLSGCVTVFVGQLLVSVGLRHTRRRSEEEGKRAAKAHSDQMAWLDAIQAVGKIVETFSDGLRGPHSAKHIFLDTSLLRILHDSCSESHLITAARKSPSQTDVLVLGRYYMDYALSTYGFMLLKLLGVMDPSFNFMTHGTRGVDVAQYMLRLRPDQILVSKLDGEGIRAPRHFVAVDEREKSIVVAIRGTNSISDIITDLLCDNEPFAGGYAHGGMKRAAESLYTAILPTLRSALAKYPSHIIAVTGHSLGAGVAILLTKVLLMNGFTDVKCYAIAPCPVFGPMHRVDSEWSDALECFVHHHDLVAKLCLASARNLALEMERIDELQLTVPEKKQIVESRRVERLEKLLLRHQRQSRDPREKQVEQLFIPTHHGIHWLIHDHDTERPDTISPGGEEEFLGQAYIPDARYASYVVRPRLFRRILITPGCVSSHFPSSYTKAFAALDLPPREVRAPLSPRTFDESILLRYDNELG